MKKTVVSVSSMRNIFLIELFCCQKNISRREGDRMRVDWKIHRFQPTWGWKDIDELEREKSP